MTEACTCCSIADQLGRQGRLYAVGPHWTANARLDHRRPALVVQTRVHRPSLEDLTSEERSTLGSVIAAASAAVGQHGNVERVYVQLFNEGRPGHVHFHVVPRFTTDAPESVGPRLPDVLPEGAFLDAEAAGVTAGRALPAGRVERSVYVRGVRRLCQWWNEKASAYRAVRLLAKRQTAVDDAELYVTAWLGLWAAAFAAAALLGDGGASNPAFWAVAVIALYRLLDMAFYEVEILLTMEPSPLRSVPRALLLRVGNLGEIAMASASLLLLRTGAPAPTTALAGYRTVTLQGEFGHPGIAADLVLVAAGATSFLILVGGIAMLVGKVAETFHEV